MKILAISGSLRSGSSNTTLLRAMIMLAPKGVELELYAGLGDLPHFNPDLEEAAPSSVRDLRTRVEQADGLLICSPEYAHGVPGSLKNALDWLVGSGKFIEKPVALINASPRSTYAQASLTETITVMTGRIVSEASIAIPLAGKKLDEAGIASHPEIGPPLKIALETFVQAIEASPSPLHSL